MLPGGGGIKTLHVDVRIISAANRDLRQDIAEKKFREDLFYRLNVFPIELPPLRERRHDIPTLVQHFARKYSTRVGRRIDTIPEDTMRILRDWSWPGNVRELENVIECMVIMSRSSVLASPPAEISEAEYVPEDNLTEMEREHILRVLRENQWGTIRRRGSCLASGTQANDSSIHDQTSRYSSQ